MDKKSIYAISRREYDAACRAFRDELIRILCDASFRNGGEPISVATPSGSKFSLESRDGVTFVVYDEGGTLLSQESILRMGVPELIEISEWVLKSLSDLE